MPVTLTDWLGSRSPEQLADVLLARPEVGYDPLPGDLTELADRLAAPNAVYETIRWLPTPAVQVIQVLQLLGPGGGGRTALADWLGCAADDDDLADTVRLLAELALVWPDGDTLRMVEPLYGRFRYPLGLGAPVEPLLSRCPAEQLRQIARALGLPTSGRKQELAARVGDLLRDPDRVRALVETAPSASRDRLIALAEQGPDPGRLPGWYGYQPPEPALSWAAARGLVFTDAYGVPQPPREVALALRGTGWHAPFHPHRLLPPLAATPPATVEHEATAAATAAVEAIGSLLATVEDAPAGLLKSGGVGVRELRRLARTTGLDAPVVRLWLEVAYEAGLIAVVPDRAGGGELLPTTGYDDWLGSEPAEQLAAVLPAWLQMAVAPLLSADPTSRPEPALVRDYDGQFARLVRQSLLDLLDTLPDGQAVADPAGLTAAVGWQAPLVIDPEQADPVIHSAWHEAQLAAVVAHGRLSSLGQALVSDDSELVTACRVLLPAASTEAVFQADLTAMVPGTPARALAELLDASADRESGGGAVTWRFSAGSVRRALDTGWQAEPLLAGLRERAAGGQLPQPLAYLVADVARRHGAVRVRTAGCVLRADDPALVAELAGARSLRTLGLSTVAPTVLSCAAPLEQALAALRTAGYAPVAEDAGGVPQLGRVERRRATTRHRRGRPEAPGPGPEEEIDPTQYAKELLAAPVRPARVPAPRAGTARPGHDWQALDQPPWQRQAEVDTDVDPTDAFMLLAAADHLDISERELLAVAFADQLPVRITYTSLVGEQTVRVIEPMELDGAHLIAWCRLREDERRFALSRVASVAPAPPD